MLSLLTHRRSSAFLLSHLHKPLPLLRTFSSSLPSTTTTTTTATTSTSTTSTNKPYYITTPIYYVNAPPHIGHAYTSVSCDIIARFLCLSNRDVFFGTGVDEHGEKVETKAREKGYEDTQAFVNEVAETFVDLLDVYNVKPTKFMRTTSTAHKQTCKYIWDQLVSNGDIYLSTYSGYYSISDECFYSPSELITNPNTTTGLPKLAPSGSEVVFKEKEDSYFFKLSKYQTQLKQHILDNPEFIQPASRRNEILAFINQEGGVHDLSVSRQSVRWGIPVPGCEGHTMYVWVDALGNYLSHLGYGQGDDVAKSPHKGGDFEKYWPPDVHVVGKDITRFHVIYWCSILLSLNLPLPTKIFSHGWWTQNGSKISKSLGNVIDPLDVYKKYGEGVRYYMFCSGIFGGDGDWSDKEVRLKGNAFLSNSYGNLVSRTLTLLEGNPVANIDVEIGVDGDADCDAECKMLTDGDRELLNSLDSIYTQAFTAITTTQLHLYLPLLTTQLSKTNEYITVNAPWTLKNGTKEERIRMQVVLHVVAENLRVCSILLLPILPSKAALILDMLGVPPSPDSASTPFIEENDTNARNFKAVVEGGGDYAFVNRELNKGAIKDSKKVWRKGGGVFPRFKEE